MGTVVTVPFEKCMMSPVEPIHSPPRGSLAILAAFTGCTSDARRAFVSIERIALGGPKLTAHKTPSVSSAMETMNPVGWPSASLIGLNLPLLKMLRVLSRPIQICPASSLKIVVTCFPLRPTPCALNVLVPFLSVYSVLSPPIKGRHLAGPLHCQIQEPWGKPSEKRFGSPDRETGRGRPSSQPIRAFTVLIK